MPAKSNASMNPQRPMFVYDHSGILVSYNGKPLFTKEALLEKFNDDHMKEAPKDNDITLAIKDFRYALIHFPDDLPETQIAHQQLSDIYHQILDQQTVSDN